jgi:biopolymer transport protein ExbB
MFFVSIIKERVRATVRSAGTRSVGLALSLTCLAATAALAQTAPSGAPPAGDTAMTGQATAVVANPYGLDALWNNGDFITHTVLVILVVMSASTWYVMVNKLVEQAILTRRGKLANSTMWQASSASDGIRNLKPAGQFFAMTAFGLNAVELHKLGKVRQVQLEEWVSTACQRSLGQATSRLQGGLALLATVGSTAPFIGLFGTVWGIYHALTAIGIAGQASIDKVAGPVGEALIMTAFGLAVAVPAVLGYNWLVRRNKVAIDTLRIYSGDLTTFLVTGVPLSQVAASQAMGGLRGAAAANFDHVAAD